MRCISSSKISGSVYTSRRTRSGSTHFARSGIRSCSMVDLLGRNDNLTPPQEEVCMFRYLIFFLGPGEHLDAQCDRLCLRRHRAKAQKKNEIPEHADLLLWGR